MNNMFKLLKWPLKCTAITTLSLALFTPALASFKDCIDEYNLHYLHCAFINQKDNALVWQKIKVTYNTGTKVLSKTICSNNTRIIAIGNGFLLGEISNGDIQGLTASHPVTLTINFSECLDAQCKTVSSLGTDRFQVTENTPRLGTHATQFEINPIYYAFNGIFSAPSATCTSSETHLPFTLDALINPS